MTATQAVRPPPPEGAQSSTYDGSTSRVPTSDKVAAGAGGIGSGSIFLLIANQFPQGSLANQLLTYISPWATAVVTAGWLYLQGELLFKWKFLWSLRQAIKVIARDLSDPNILDSEKQELQEQLKDMRQLRREFFRKQIKITP